MASQERASAEMLVEDIAAMGDAELAKFMKDHRLPDGGYELPVDGWDRLSKEQRIQLAEKLQAQERALAQDPATHSLPLDLDQLDARLHAVASDDDRSAQRPRRQSLSPTPPYDDMAERRRRETYAYHDLVNDGGRPLYHIDCLEQISNNAEANRDMLWPWQDFSNGRQPWQVFQSQLERWEDFRKWQNDNRGLEDETSFLDYVESIKVYTKRWYTKKGCVERLAQIEADPTCLNPGWERRQQKRETHRYFYRERGCNGFSDYEEAAKRRLAQHDFSQPFRLNKNPKQQDKLTTWIEYLNYEYWWLDRYTESLGRLKPGHDKAWQELVDTKMVKPHETQEYIRSLESAWQRGSEQEQAEELVENAKLEGERVYIQTQKDPQRLRIPESRRISMIENATTKIKAAKAHLQETIKRNEHITNFVRVSDKYAAAEDNIARQNPRIEWILEQTSLIEAELSQLPKNEVSGGKKRKSSADEHLATTGNQKRRRSHRHLSSRGDNSNAMEEIKKILPDISTLAQEECQSSRVRKSPRRTQKLPDVSPKTVPRGHRRSARIATQRKPHEVIVTPNTPPPPSRLRQREKAIQVPKSPKFSGPIPSLKNKTAPATMERGSRRRSQRGIAQSTATPMNSERPRRNRGERKVG